MSPAFVLTDLASELALFAAVGFLLFAIDDLAVDLIYFARRMWRALAVYSRYPRAFAGTLPAPRNPGRIAVFIPAWDESAVIADMLRATLRRWGDGDYRIFVGFYANDPLTEAAIGHVDDSRIEAVLVEDHGPTTKADCLNRLYDALLATECSGLMYQSPKLGAWLGEGSTRHLLPRCGARAQEDRVRNPRG